MKTNPSRRQFLHASAVGAAAAASAPVIRIGPLRSDTLRVGVAGVRGRGNHLLNGFEDREGVEVIALADVDAGVLAKRAEELGKKSGRTITTFTDLRDMLESGGIDAVGIGTPNHLHALHTVWSVAAGKDVYVEKPVSHNIWEGRQMVAAAKKYGRIVQTGTQSRSSHALRDAIEWLDSGAIGERTLGWGTCFKPRPSIGKVDGPQPVPEGVDYRLYMGPRGEQPLNRRSLHYDWHWQSATGNGDLGNQGVHQVDQVRWALGMPGIAPAAVSIGGRFGYDDDGDTPNTMITLLDYQPVPMIFEVRGLPRNKAAQAEMKSWRSSMDRRLGSAVGAVVHAEGGHLRFPSYTAARAYDASGKEIKKWDGADNHIQNFVDAVRARDASLINASIEDGHVSAALCHMGNDSLTLGETATRGEIERAVATQPALAHAFDRLLAHLDLNGVDLGATPLTFGASLRFDAVTGTYADNAAANELMRGSYAEGFEVPEIV
ncbi:MAG: Gfo/Idh/MocA family oxidoreductase [Planctomycetota bacterium]